MNTWTGRAARALERDFLNHAFRKYGKQMRWDRYLTVCDWLNTRWGKQLAASRKNET